MPLLEGQLGNTNLVFAEIQRQYNPLRNWTVNDLIYTAPTPAWVAQTRQQRGRAGGATPTQYEVKLDPVDQRTGRCVVTVVALTADRPVHVAGSILNH